MAITPSFIDRVRSRLTGTPAEAYATRRVAAADLTRLRKQLTEQTRRLEESVLTWDSYVQPWMRYADGDRTLMPPGGMWAGASGTVNDRKWGKDVPLYWTEPEVRQFRVLSRLLCDTNSYAIGFLGLLVDFHLRQGYGWQACLKGAKKGAYDTGTTGDVDPSVRACQTALDEWRDGQPTDPASSWPIVSREAFRRLRRDGEVFLRLFRGDRGRLPQMRFVEPEQIGAPSGADGPTSFGILTDPRDIRRVLAYFVRDPNGDGTDGVWVTKDWSVDPREVAEIAGDRYPVVPGCVLHLKVNVDSSIKRGLPDFFPVSDDLDRVRALNRNMAVVAALQSAISHVIQYATATAAQVSTLLSQGQTYTREQILAGVGAAGSSSVSVKQYEPGSVIHTDSGRQFLPGPVSQSAAGFIQVAQACLRGAGCRWRFPEYFSGDASNGSYASLKESGSPFVACVEGGQLEWGAFERAVGLCVLYLSAESGRLDRHHVERVDIETQAPKVVMTDKGQEDGRRKTQYDAGALSLTEWIQADGRDPKHTFENLKAEAKQGLGKNGQQQQPPGGGGGGNQPGPGGEPPQPAPAGGSDAVMDKILGESAGRTPPRPGLVFNDQTHRWYRPEDAKEYHDDGSAVGENPHPKTREAWAAVKDYLADRDGGASQAELVEVMRDAGIPTAKAKAVLNDLFDRGLLAGDEDSLTLHAAHGKAAEGLAAVTDYLGEYDEASPAELVEHLKDQGFEPDEAARVVDDLHHAGALTRDGGKFRLPSRPATEGGAAGASGTFLSESGDPLSDAEPAVVYAALVQAMADGDEATAKYLRAHLSKVAESVQLEEATGRKEGEVWQGTSGRWFTVKSGRVVPAKNPKAEPKPGPKGGESPQDLARRLKGERDKEREPVRAAYLKAKADPANLTAEDVRHLADNLHKLTRDELREHARDLRKKLGGLKTELVDRILEHVRGQLKANAPIPLAGGSDGGRGGEGTGGADAGTGRPVAGAAGAAGGEGGAGERLFGPEPLGPRTARSVPATTHEVNKRIDRFQQFFNKRGQHQVAEWLGRLRDHVNAVGAESALAAVGGPTGKGGNPDLVQYWGVGTEEANWKNMGQFMERYLARNGIVAVTGETSAPDFPLVSALAKPDRYLAGDFKPSNDAFKDKLDEAKHLPGLEGSEDLGKIMDGATVTHLTPAVTGKLDERYGKGRWIVKCYSDEAAAGYGIFFPQRAAAVATDARNAIWDAGSHLDRYGLSLARDDAGKVTGLKHTGGKTYPFGSTEYKDTIHGDARHWGDRAAAAADHEHGVMLPEGKFMVQPAFEAVGISDEERAKGKTWHEKNEGRVHLVTRPDGNVEVIPHSTWLKGGNLPVVFEDEDTRAMAKAAQDAINQLPPEARKGQVYAPDVMKTKDGYKVVELNAQGDYNGSGYLHDNHFTIDSYVSHLTVREPAHVGFIRSILSSRKKADATPS